MADSASAAHLLDEGWVWYMPPAEFSDLNLSERGLYYMCGIDFESDVVQLSTLEPGQPYTSLLPVHPKCAHVIMATATRGQDHGDPVRFKTQFGAHVDGRQFQLYRLPPLAGLHLDPSPTTTSEDRLVTIAYGQGRQTEVQWVDFRDIFLARDVSPDVDLRIRYSSARVVQPDPGRQARDALLVAQNKVEQATRMIRECSDDASKALQWTRVQHKAQQRLAAAETEVATYEAGETAAGRRPRNPARTVADDRVPTRRSSRINPPAAASTVPPDAPPVPPPAPVAPRKFAGVAPVPPPATDAPSSFADVAAAPPRPRERSPVVVSPPPRAAISQRDRMRLSLTDTVPGRPRLVWYYGTNSTWARNDTVYQHDMRGRAFYVRQIHRASYSLELHPESQHAFVSEAHDTDVVIVEPGQYVILRTPRRAIAARLRCDWRDVEARIACIVPCADGQCELNVVVCSRPTDLKCTLRCGVGVVRLRRHQTVGSSKMECIELKQPDILECPEDGGTPRCRQWGFLPPPRLHTEPGSESPEDCSDTSDDAPAAARGRLLGEGPDSTDGDDDDESDGDPRRRPLGERARSADGDGDKASAARSSPTASDSQEFCTPDLEELYEMMGVEPEDDPSSSGAAAAAPPSPPALTADNTRSDAVAGGAAYSSPESTDTELVAPDPHVRYMLYEMMGVDRQSPSPAPAAASSEESGRDVSPPRPRR